MRNWQGLRVAVLTAGILCLCQYSYAFNNRKAFGPNDDAQFNSVQVQTEIYDSNGWNGDLTVPTKDAVRDKIEAAVSNVFQTTSNVANLVTPTDNLNIGNTANIGKVGISGDTDEVQLEVDAAPSQSAFSVIRAKDKTGTQIFSLANSGALTIGKTGSNSSVGIGSITLTDDQDGQITIAADGDGTDENLILNLDDTSNTGVFSSGTGLATLDFGTMLLKEGSIQLPDLGYIADGNGVPIMSMDAVASAVNRFVVVDAATGTSPIISADGSDANIGIKLNTKGSGGVVIQTIATPTQSTISAGLVVNNSSNSVTAGAFKVLSADGTAIISSDPVIGGLSTTGKIIAYGTNDVGWSVQNAANQACNTTCKNACAFGIDTSAIGNLLLCTNAAADSCLCIGPQ